MADALSSSSCYGVLVLGGSNQHHCLACPCCLDKSERGLHAQHVLGLFRQHILLLFFFLPLKQSQRILKAEKKDPFLAQCFEARTCC